MSRNSNIDGIYVSEGFKAWKIYTENNITFMECYTHTILKDIVFKVEKRFDKDEFYLTLRSNNNRVPLMYCLIYMKDGIIYLDQSYFGANRTINPITKDGEYKKYDKQIYTKDEHLAFQGQRQGYWYQKSGKCFYNLDINYPKYEITKISIDDDFNITNIEKGEIKYINGEFIININNYNSRYDDIFYNDNAYHIDYISNLNNIGEKIYKSIYKFDSYEILNNSSGYEKFLAQLLNSSLIIFNKTGFIINDMEIISMTPTVDQLKISELEILDDNVIKITIDYDWESRYKIVIYYKR